MTSKDVWKAFCLVFFVNLAAVLSKRIVNIFFFAYKNTGLEVSGSHLKPSHEIDSCTCCYC